MKKTIAVLLLSLHCYGQSSEAKHWADHWADQYGVERELVYAVIEAESAWNPHAISSAGAVGLMQLMPETAAAFGVRVKCKTFPHHRLKGHDRFRLRVGDYRIIYTFDAERNVIHLLAVGNRREIYRDY